MDKWIDITEVDNVTPISAVRWKSALNINYDTGTTVAAFSEVPGLTVDRNFNWRNGSGSTVGHYSLHRFGGTSEIYVAQFGGTDGQLEPTVSSTYRVGVKNQAFSASGFYDTTVQISGETFYEIDWTLWNSYTPLYFPYSGTPIQAGCVYVRINGATIVLDTETATINSSGGSETVTVQADYDWSASTSDAWITISPSSGVSGTSVVTISATDYTSTTEDRIGSVTFECSGESVTFILTQKKVPQEGGHPLYIGSTTIPTIMIGNTPITAAYLGETLVYSSGPFIGIKLSPNDMSFEYTGGTGTLKIKCSTGWTLTYDSNYITVDQASGGSGDTTVTITAGTNTGQVNISTVITATTTDGLYSGTTNVIIKAEATLPGQFLFNYNAKEYVASTYTIPNTSGATFQQDMVLTARTSTIRSRITHNNDHLSIPASAYTTFNFASTGQNPLNISDSNTAFTVVFKAKYLGTNSNRGNFLTVQDSTGGICWSIRIGSRETYQANDTRISQVVGNTTPNFDKGLSYVCGDTITGVVRFYKSGSNVMTEIFDLTDGTSVNEFSSPLLSTEVSTKFSFFCIYDRIEGFPLEFYWCYVTPELLTSQEIQRVVQYNEDL